jgi:hypothetical protein
MIRSKVQKITPRIKNFLYFVINLIPNPMNVKTNIRLIGHIRLFLLLGFLLLFLAWATFNETIAFTSSGLSSAAGCILLFLSRNRLIIWSLKHSPHPDLLYAVLEKMGFTGGLHWSLADVYSGKISTPEYPTTQFLADNDLDTDIGPRQARLRRVLIMFIPTVGFFLYCLLSDNLYSGTEILIGGIMMIQLLVLSNMKKKARNSQPLVRFTTAGLLYEGILIPWESIDQWEYARDAHYHGIIMIRYSDPHQAMQQTTIDLATLHTNKIDFLLLMTWFENTRRFASFASTRKSPLRSAPSTLPLSSDHRG